ncbi:MAG: nitrous oxide reductase accessory protein NosL [Bacteroidetes bacterium]|nr:nitrous oxide reductase accessory protein NosL [Bacteroidota bacterium]
MKNISLTFVVLLLGFAACKPAPEPINYASDSCHFCKMTIVSKPFSAELVTQKGKVYKFDAIECMMNHLKADSQTEYALHLVHDLQNPDGGFTNAHDAIFLISREIKSPMGANLSAHKNKEEAAKYDGKLYYWDELKAYFNSQQ